MTMQKQTYPATITVAFVNPPQPGKRTGSVRDTTGEYYNVWDNQIAHFHAGETYDIQYSIFRTQSGKDSKTIQRFAMSNAAPQQQQFSPQPAPQYQAPQSAPAPRPHPVQNGAAAAPAANQYYRPTSPEDKLSMFVTAIVKAGVQSGQVQFNDEAIAQAIINAVNGYRVGWQSAYQANRPQPATQQQPMATPGQSGMPAPNPMTPPPGLNDQIPF